MIRIYYAIASDSVDPVLLAKVTKLVERYAALLDYDNIFKESLQRPSEAEPTVIKGPKNKLAVIQVAVDVVPADKFVQILKFERSIGRLTKLARSIVRLFPTSLMVKLLKKLGISDVEANIVLGKLTFAIGTKDDFTEGGFASPSDFIKLAKNGWNNLVVINEDKGTITLCSKLTPKCFVIPIKAIESYASKTVVSVDDAFKNAAQVSLGTGLASALD